MAPRRTTSHLVVKYALAEVLQLEMHRPKEQEVVRAIGGLSVEGFAQRQRVLVPGERRIRSEDDRYLTCVVHEKHKSQRTAGPCARYLPVWRFAQ